MEPFSTPAPGSQTPDPRPQTQLRSWLLIVAALVVAGLAISPESFWMDEASTASSAIQPTLGSWWSYLGAHQGSDPQMPLYMIYVWGWVKLFGCAEWVLRAANVPWLILGLLAIPRRQAGAVLALVASPFLWYYLNEARPYMMQMSASLMLAGSLMRLVDSPSISGAEAGEKKWMRLFCLGLVILAGSSMLGMIWVVAAAGVFLLLFGGRFLRLARENWLALLLTTLALAGLAGYYAWTIKHGDSGTPGSTGVANVIFIFYEVLGLAGIGPGRNDIHAAGLKAFHPAYLLPLAVFGLALAGVFCAGVSRVAREIPRRTWVALLIPVAGMTILLLLAGKTRHISLLGRHFAPLAVCLLLLLGAAAQRLWQLGGWQRWLSVSWLALNLVSAGSLRWCERHEKDDYRTAAAIAIAAYDRGERIWWCGDGTTGFYYHVPLSPSHSPVAVPGKIWLLANPRAAWLTNSPMPALLVLSKPELHDENGFVQDYLQRNHFTRQQSFSVFTIWTHP